MPVTSVSTNCPGLRLAFSIPFFPVARAQPARPSPQRRPVSSSPPVPVLPRLQQARLRLHLLHLQRQQQQQQQQQRDGEQQEQPQPQTQPPTQQQQQQQQQRQKRRGLTHTTTAGQLYYRLRANASFFSSAPTVVSAFPPSDPNSRPTSLFSPAHQPPQTDNSILFASPFASPPPSPFWPAPTPAPATPPAATSQGRTRGRRSPDQSFSPTTPSSPSPASAPSSSATPQPRPAPLSQLQLQRQQQQQRQNQQHQQRQPPPPPPSPPPPPPSPPPPPPSPQQQQQQQQSEQSAEHQNEDPSRKKQQSSAARAYNIPWTERKARSERMRALWRDPAWRAAMMERRARESTISARSSAAKALWRDDDFRARQRAARLGRPAPNKGVSPGRATRLRMSLARRGARFTDETRRRMSASKLDRPDNDDWPRLISESKKGKTKKYFAMRREFRALHRDLKLWSDSYRSMHGRLPSADSYEKFVAPMMVFRIKRYLTLRDAMGIEELDADNEIISK